MRRAFTIVEILIVAGVISLLAALVIPSFGVWRERTVVRSAARDIESILKLARSKSLASEDGAKYGVLFYDSSTAFQLCKNPSYSGGTFDCGTIINTYRLPSTLSFCTIFTSSAELKTTPLGLGVNPGVFFSKLTGEFENIDLASSEGTIYFYNKNKIPSPCGTPTLPGCLLDKTCGGITITKSGVIYEKQ